MEPGYCQWRREYIKSFRGAEHLWIRWKNVLRDRVSIFIYNHISLINVNIYFSKFMMYYKRIISLTHIGVIGHYY